MNELRHPDNLYLRAAQGWLELGNHVEAGEEIKRIAPKQRIHPEVLEIKWHVLAKERLWDRCVDIANALIRAVPEQSSGWIHLSYALHEMRMTEDAYENLASMAEHFPDEPVLRYNLACYSCQLGHLREARNWLSQALRLGNSDQIKSMALADPDLKPLWKQIENL